MEEIVEQDRRDLLALARESISASLGARSLPKPTERLLALGPGGAFVTLKAARALRGCIGRLQADEPLALTVRSMAVAAAFDDPRFPPLKAEELCKITIEISALSAMADAEPDDVVPGLHGVLLSRAGRSGVFLPQVAAEQGWDRDELLNQVCVKAGLPYATWKDEGTRIRTFTATVFSEAGVSEAPPPA
jgi:uncharacterized protein